MSRLVVILALLAGCKKKKTYELEPIEDAKPHAIDAGEATADAAAATKSLRATKVAVGDHFSCAVMSDATARCWGKNSDGQLGNGTTTDSAVPMLVPLRGVTDVVVGTAHACALLDDTSVTCWGRINFGAKTNLTKPAAVPGLQRAKQLFAVGTASCATLDDGPLVCFGDVDQYGRFRPAGAAPEHRAPAPVPDLSRVVQLVATGALSADRHARWFGDALVLDDVTEIAADGERLCGLRSDGVVICAGTRHCPWPKKTKQPAPAVEELALPKAKHLAFDGGTCVVTQSGRVHCLDDNDGCRAADPWPGLADVEEVAGSCARTRSGDLRCWFGTGKPRSFTKVAGVARITSIAGSTTHVCVISAGEIYCLGSNESGSLGRGEADASLHTDARSIAF